MIIAATLWLAGAMFSYGVSISAWKDNKAEKMKLSSKIILAIFILPLWPYFQGYWRKW